MKASATIFVECHLTIMNSMSHLNVTNATSHLYFTKYHELTESLQALIALMKALPFFWMSSNNYEFDESSKCHERNESSTFHEISRNQWIITGPPCPHESAAIFFECHSTITNSMGHLNVTNAKSHLHFTKYHELSESSLALTALMKALPYLLNVI